MPDMATVRVHRPSGRWQDALRSYVLYLDERRAGRIKPGGTCTLQVSAGPHVLRARIDTVHSDAFAFLAPAGQVVELEIAPGETCPPWRLFSRKGWMSIRPLS